MTRKLLLFIFITALIAGCHPDGADYVDELDLVLTTHNETFDFGATGTFALPAQIPKVTGALIEGEDPEFVDPADAALILSAIRANMEARGFEEVTFPEDADLIILPATISTTTLVYYCDYWGYYWGWYYPYYGGCYYPSGYTYTTGSLIISMQNNSEPNPDPISVWGAVLNGLLEGGDASISARVQKGIDQAFDQSPYLKSN